MHIILPEHQAYRSLRHCAKTESVLGFTTTGASILNDIEALPDGLQFWRIASAWMGGIGIVTLVSLVISAQQDRHLVLASAELSDLAKSYYGGRKKTLFIG